MHFSAAYLSVVAVAMAACFNVVSSQAVSSDTVNEGIANVLLQLNGTRIVPNLINASQLELHGLLVQQFGNANISTGQLVDRVSDVANAPKWYAQYSADASKSDVFSSAMYTVMTLDPGAASDEPRNIVRHYLANNVSLSSQSGAFTNLTKPIAGWFSPAPPKGSGVHRYTTLVFRQTNTTLPDDLAHTNTQIDTNFNLTDYIQRAALGPIVAATFFLAQNDDTSASVTASGVVSTTAVPSASVSAVAQSVSTSLSSVYAASASSSSDGKSAASMGSLAVSQASMAIAATALFVALGAFAL